VNDVPTGVFAGVTDRLFEACGDPPGLVCEWVLEFSDNAAAARFADWFVAKPLKILLIFLVALIVNRILRGAIRRMIDRVVAEREEEAEAAEDVGRGRLAGWRAFAAEKAQTLAAQRERRRQRAQALGMVLTNISAIAVYALALIIAIAEFGVSLGPLVAGAGIVGVALGFGAQSLVRDFLSGMFMLVEDQYGVGDVIDVGDAAGLVEEVTLRTTRLRDLEGTVWYIPNGEIRRVANKSQQWGRAVLDVGVAYDTDLDHAMAVMKRVADEVWQEQGEGTIIIEEPEVVGVIELGDSEIVLRVMMKTEPVHQFKTTRELRRRMKEAFDLEGISIPFPQRTVWLMDEATSPTTDRGDTAGGDADADR
jgi:moderate conductance mechanosensitive channel